MFDGSSDHIVDLAKDYCRSVVGLGSNPTSEISNKMKFQAEFWQKL